MASPAKYWYAETVAALFVLLFTYTGIDKLRDYSRFAKSMLHSSIIAPFARPLAAVVPGLELFTAVLLIIPVSRRLGLWMAAAIILVFTLYIGYMLATASTLPCTCAGIFEQMTWRQHLLFNFCFLALAVTSLLVNHKNIIMINRS